MMESKRIRALLCLWLTLPQLGQARYRRDNDPPGKQHRNYQSSSSPSRRHRQPPFHPPEHNQLHSQSLSTDDPRARGNPLVFPPPPPPPPTHSSIAYYSATLVGGAVVATLDSDLVDGETSNEAHKDDLLRGSTTPPDAQASQTTTPRKIISKSKAFVPTDNRWRTQVKEKLGRLKERTVAGFRSPQSSPDKAVAEAKSHETATPSQEPVRTIPPPSPSTGSHRHQSTAAQVKSFLRALGPTMIAVFGSRGSTGGVSFGRLYLMALLGSSVGFYMFLYFISIGYALGIALPVAVAMVHSSGTMNVWDAIHSGLVVLWGVRLAAFSLYREHVSWPALHSKIVQVNSDPKRRPALHQKVLCWVVYSFLYVCMMAPCWFRLESSTKRGGKVPTMIAILLQVFGLSVESIADWQKCQFKEQNRMGWCNAGLWKYSTHPNYAGEWIFWLGTVLASLFPILFNNAPAVALVKLVLVTIGFVFLTSILAGATNKLSQNQMTKYGGITGYVDFRERYGVFGLNLSSQRTDATDSSQVASSLVSGDVEDAN
jgi:steroid 5-alpha reductase family enzyme